MKKLTLALLLLAPAPTAPALASDDPVECAKKEGAVKCEAKQDIVVDSISVNGGDCDVPAGDKALHHAYHKGEKFSVPVMGESIALPFTGCGYVRTVTIKMHDGKKKTFNAL